MYIYVSKADIAESKRLRNTKGFHFSPLTECPIALAIRRRFPKMNVEVRAWTIGLGSLGDYHLPPLAVAFSTTFASRTAPIRFRITKKV